MPPDFFLNFRPSESASGAFSDHLGMDHITTNYYLAGLKVTITSLLINIYEMFSVLIFSAQQDATETW